MEKVDECRACLRPIAAGHYVCQRCYEEQYEPLIPADEKYCSEVQAGIERLRRRA